MLSEPVFNLSNNIILSFAEIVHYSGGGQFQLNEIATLIHFTIHLGIVWFRGGFLLALVSVHFAHAIHCKLFCAYTKNEENY